MCIKERIRRSICNRQDEIFRTRDFRGFGSKTAVGMALRSLVAEDFIVKLSRGKYMRKPDRSEKDKLSRMRRELGHEPLTVYCDGRIVGVLSGNEREVSFAYDEEWLKSGFPLSFAMPLRKKAFGDEQTQAFFGNLLPESHIYKMLCVAKKIPQNDLISFFKYFGKECAGALTVAQSGEPLSETGELRDITDELRSFLGQNMGGNMQIALKARLSLGGAQDKLPVVFKDGRIYLPNGPTTHIIKPDLKDCPYTARNEHFCMRLAASLGVEVANTDVLVLPEKDVFITERYDRATTGNVVTRLHQQDFCQALGLSSYCKYQGNGVFFGFSDMLDVCGKNGVSVGDKFAKAQIFNYLIGNFDAHAKNFSILHLPDGPCVAPLYDLVCTEAYPAFETTFGMMFGRHLDKNEVDENDFPLAALDCGIEMDEYVELAGSMAEACKANVSPLAAEHRQRYGDCEIYGIMEDIILESCGKMLEILERFRQPHSPGM